MQIGEMKARPPHIKFKSVPVEDRTASITAGHPVYNDVAVVVLTPSGSRDSVEKPVTEWLEQTDQQVRDERMPAAWAEQFRAAYQHWKNGEAIPLNGSALSLWPAITPSELQNCKNINVLTVEDLAAINDEGTRRLGMGGLILKQRAQQYLAAADGPGKLVAENAALKVALVASEARREVLERRVVELENLNPNAKSPVKVGEPPVDAASKV